MPDKIKAEVLPFKVKANKLKVSLKAPKNLYNKFGQYNYRNAEGICEAVKPYLGELGLLLKVEDEIVLVGNRYYVKATATLSDCESNEFETASAFAREDEEKKGMDSAQLTGACSSYARKYALNGLFLLDDTKDADSDEYKERTTGMVAPSKEDPKSQEIPKQVLSMKAGAKQVVLIRKKLNEKEIPESAVLKKYGVATLEELPATQVTNVLHDIDVTPSRKKEETIDKFDDGDEQLPFK